MKKIRNTKRTFHTKMGTIKDRNGLDPTEAEDIKKVVSIHTEKAMATHSNTLAWKIPWTEEPGRLQSVGSLRVGHD